MGITYHGRYYYVADEYELMAFILWIQSEAA
jgi:hypothetical protein